MTKHAKSLESLVCKNDPESFRSAIYKISESIKSLIEKGFLRLKLSNIDNTKKEIYCEVEYIYCSDIEKKMNEYYNAKIIELDLKNNDAIKSIESSYNSLIESWKTKIDKVKEYEKEIKDLKLQISKEKTTIDIITEQFQEVLDESKAYCAEAEFYKTRGFWSRLFNRKYVQ